MDSICTRVFCRQCFRILNSNLAGAFSTGRNACSRRLSPRVSSRLDEKVIRASTGVTVSMLCHHNKCCKSGVLISSCLFVLKCVTKMII